MAILVDLHCLTPLNACRTLVEQTIIRYTGANWKGHLIRDWNTHAGVRRFYTGLMMKNYDEMLANVAPSSSS